jgi:3-oxoacyl-[acyl-carrier protein] reductase
LDLGLKNKNALITGGSKGIGFAIAKALAEEGCNVAIGARGRERLDQAVAELSKLGVKAVPIVVDFITEEGCLAFVDSAVAALGGCDILVNNVGGTIPGTLGTFTVEKWCEIIDYAVTCPDLGRPENAAKNF